MFRDTKQVTFASRATAPNWGAPCLLMLCFSVETVGPLLGAPEHKMQSKCGEQGVIYLPWLSEKVRPIMQSWSPREIYCRRFWPQMVMLVCRRR